MTTEPTPPPAAEQPAETPKTETPPVETPPPAAPSGMLTRVQAAAARQRVGGEEYMFTIRDEVAELLKGSPYDVDSYLQAAYREVLKSKLLVQAAQESGPTLLGAVMLGATLQLPIGGPLGQFYLTPRGEKVGNGWRQMCVPMIGYRGFFELGYRSGRVALFDYRVVREGDTLREWSDSEGGNRYEWQRAAGANGDEDEKGDKRELTGVVAIAKLLNGAVQFQYMTKATIDRRKPTRTQNTPWEGKHSDAMYVKTPHRELAKFLQLSVASAQAVQFDEQIAEWNRATEALSVVSDQAEHVYNEGAGELEAGNVPGSGETTASEPVSEPVPVSAAESPKPADGRTAASPAAAQVPDSAGVDALDLPAFVRAQGRNMTEAEFERYSAAGGE